MADTWVNYVTPGLLSIQSIALCTRSCALSEICSELSFVTPDPTKTNLCNFCSASWPSSKKAHVFVSFMSSFSCSMNHFDFGARSSTQRVRASVRVSRLGTLGNLPGHHAGDELKLSIRSTIKNTKTHRSRMDAGNHHICHEGNMRIPLRVAFGVDLRLPATSNAARTASRCTVFLAARRQVSNASCMAIGRARQNFLGDERILGLSLSID